MGKFSETQRQITYQAERFVIRSKPAVPSFRTMFRFISEFVFVLTQWDLFSYKLDQWLEKLLLL